MPGKKQRSVYRKSRERSFHGAHVSQVHHDEPSTSTPTSFPGHIAFLVGRKAPSPLPERQYALGTRLHQLQIILQLRDTNREENYQATTLYLKLKAQIFEPETDLLNLESSHNNHQSIWI